LCECECVGRKGRPERMTSPPGACFPNGAMEGGSEENPQPT